LRRDQAGYAADHIGQQNAALVEQLVRKFEIFQ